MPAEWRFLDDIDYKIIELLQKDGRMSFIDIGKKVGLSEGAVRRRIKLLQERGVIKRFTVEVDHGYGISAVIFIQFDQGISPRQIVDGITKVEGVEKIYELTGRFDAIVIMSAPSIGELNDRIDSIRNVEGVKNTETAVILRVIG